MFQFLFMVEFLKISYNYYPVFPHSFLRRNILKCKLRLKCKGNTSKKIMTSQNHNDSHKQERNNQQQLVFQQSLDLQQQLLVHQQQLHHKFYILLYTNLYKLYLLGICMILVFLLKKLPSELKP